MQTGFEREVDQRGRRHLDQTGGNHAFRMAPSSNMDTSTVIIGTYTQHLLIGVGKNQEKNDPGGGRWGQGSIRMPPARAGLQHASRNVEKDLRGVELEAFY